MSTPGACPKSHPPRPSWALDQWVSSPVPLTAVTPLVRDVAHKPIALVASLTPEFRRRLRDLEK